MDNTLKFKHQTLKIRLIQVMNSGTFSKNNYFLYFKAMETEKGPESKAASRDTAKQVRKLH